MAAIDADFAFRHANPPTFEGEGASVASVWPFWGPLLFGTSALCQGLRRNARTRGWNQRLPVTAKHTAIGDDRDHATPRKVLRLAREFCD